MSRKHSYKKSKDRSTYGRKLQVTRSMDWDGYDFVDQEQLDKYMENRESLLEKKLTEMIIAKIEKSIESKLGESCFSFQERIKQIRSDVPNDTKTDGFNKLNEIKQPDLLFSDENVLNQIKQMREQIKKLEKEINDLETRLKESIPKENQCCICFGYTDKKQFVIPCGHFQYCNICITMIDECVLCKEKITGVQKIY
jgi:hypothetical protein